MRRTQARQVDLPGNLQADPCLADVRCRGCRKLGVAIVALGRNDNGAVEMAFCTVACAIPWGWPWLAPRVEAVKPCL